MVTRKQLVGHLQTPGGPPQVVEFVNQQRPVLTNRELAGGLQWVNGDYESGNVLRYGAKGDGTTPDSGAFNEIGDILDELDEADGYVIIIPPGDYLIDSTVVWNKDNVVVLAHGARFIPDSDITLFDFNSNALPDDSIIRRSVYWYGGFFDYGDGPTSLVATGIKNNAARSFTVKDVRFRGLKHGVEVGALDSIRVSGCFFRNFERGVYFPKFYTYSGTHTGSNNASTLTDSTQSWATNELLNGTITNTTDGSSGTITANTATTVTATLSGGTDNDWDTSDAYEVTKLQTAQDIWISDSNFSVKGGIDATCIDNTGGGFDLTVRDCGVALNAGVSDTMKFYYHQLGNAVLDGGIRILDSATEQATDQTLIDIDDNSTTDNLDGLDVVGCHFGSSGATVISGDRIEGKSNFLRNKFDGANQTAILIGALRPDAICNIDGNRFDQTATAGGTLWDISTQTTAEVRIGVNSYNSSDIGTRTISSNTTITYAEFRNYTVASASTITIEPDARTVEITGTTTINTINATWKGHVVRFLFNSVVTVTDSTGNIDLGANFVAAGNNDMLTLYCDGSRWRDEGLN
jgi:hypothetical protein